MSERVSPPLQGAARKADLTVHALGVPLGVLGALVLLGLTLALHPGDPTALLAVALYTGGLVAMLGFSAAYNLARRPQRRAWLRRADHATIYVMIAGTYTPFMLLEVGGVRGWCFAGFVWLLALAGAALKVLSPHRLEKLSIALYLMLGWSGLLLLERLLMAVDTTTLWLLLAGGLVYTAGVGVYIAERFVYNRAAWHACVLVAAMLHYAAVLQTIVAAA